MARQHAHGRQGVLLLTAAVVCACLPLLLHLSAWLACAVLLIGAWKMQIARGGLPQPAAGVLLLFALVSATGVWVGHGGAFGRDAGASLTVLMVCLKLIEARAPREMRFLALSGYALLSSSALFSQSLWTALAMLPGLVLLTACLIAAGERPGAPGWQPLGQAVRLLLQATPFMLAGFLLFPRADFASWRLPQDAARAMTGFGGTMSPGSLGRLARSDAIAFRVTFDGQPPSQEELYWRGRVLWLYDGTTWHGDDGPGPPTGSLPEADGALLRYSVLLEPHNQPWLFALDIPRQPPPIARLGSDYTLYLERPLQATLSYAAVSVRGDAHRERLRSASARKYLQLPDENPRSVRLARQWAAAAGNGEAVVQRALDFFRQDFRYTLSPPVLRSYDQVDAFLFGSRSGFCEHYAGSFVFLMRAAGIPARVVTGYQGGEIDAGSSLVTVRHAHAHAWAEVWHAGKGWVRVDPVTVLAPGQVDAGTPAPPQAREAAERRAAGAAPGRERHDRAAPVVQRSSHLAVFDKLDFYWKRSVIDYRESDQRQLLERLTGRRPRPAQLLGLLGFVTLALAAVAAAFAVRHGHFRPRDPVQQAWQRFQAKCARAGCAPHPGEGPLDFAGRCTAKWPHQAPSISAIGRRYVELHYGRKGGRKDAVHFRDMVRRLAL